MIEHNPWLTLLQGCEPPWLKKNLILRDYVFESNQAYASSLRDRVVVILMFITLKRDFLYYYYLYYYYYYYSI